MKQGHTSVRVAIVIVTYNGRAYVPPLFESLRAHTDLTTAVIVVVDNHSTDGTLEALERERERTPGMHLLPQASNSGFTGGNNIGLIEARRLGAEFAFLLNHDTEVTPHWLEPLLAVMRERAEVA